MGSFKRTTAKTYTHTHFPSNYVEETGIAHATKKLFCFSF